MATIKLIFRESSSIDGEGALYLRIIHKRMVRQIHTGCRVFSNEWDDEDCTVKSTKTGSRATHLSNVVNCLKINIQRLNTIIADLDCRKDDYTADEVVEKYMSSETVVGFISFARKVIEDTRHLGKRTTAEHYASALNSFMRYNGKHEIPFEKIDHKLISGYENYLRNLNLCPNTTSYYMRSLRALYNQAVEQDLTKCRDPFKHVYTGVAKTVKRSVPVDRVKALNSLDLSQVPALELARDLFIFSVFTRGMAFIDMAYLKTSSIRNGFLTYRRHKTTQQLIIRWEKSMHNIAAKYSAKESEYVFPLINSTNKDVRTQYLNAYKSLSRHLRKLGEMIGLSEPLTFHRARHTWASVARSNKVPISVIREGMGHDSERTTRIYLDSLDTDAVDNANSEIIGLLNK